MNGKVPAPPRIRILLIDDKPEGLWNDREPSLPEHPALPEELRTSFELRWIATAGEAREYLDLTRMIGRHNPSALDGAGTVPEIVVIDYSLTQDPRTVEQRLSQNAPELWKELSPIVPLRRIAESMGLPLPHKGEQYDPQFNTEGSTSTDKDKERENDRIKEGENYGCFVGGLIISTFADHPCAPVTVTIRQPEQLRGTHTGFFQWLMLTESSGKLYAVGRAGINWTRIAREGANLLRKRIADLAHRRAIALSFNEMLRLARKEDVSAVAIASKYGVRSLPISGLFFDKPEPQRSAEAQRWAVGKDARKQNEPKGLLEQLTDRKHFDELANAETLASDLWEAYSNCEQVRDRLKLANLARQWAADSRTDQDEFAALWSRFSTSPFQPGWFAPQPKDPSIGAKQKRRNQKGAPDLDKGIDVRMGRFTDRARRWACLMVIVRLLKLRADALQHIEQSNEITEETEWVIGLLRAPLQLRDLYLAIFPAATNPVDLNDFTGWQHALERWKPPIRMNDFLPIAPDGKFAKNQKKPLTISDDDRRFMEWCALSIQFLEHHWDAHAKFVIRGAAIESRP